uniref:tetratricopeptide repeat protein n=1 Tax=uncultured Fluviicola sp. TaxID=463303 RepID=UPI0025FAAE04
MKKTICFFSLLFSFQFSYAQKLSLPQKTEVYDLISQMRDEKTHTPDQILELGSRVLELDPTNIKVKALRGKVLNKLGRFQEALEDLNTFMTQQPGSVMALIYRAESYIGLKQVEKAKEDLKNAESKSGNNRVVSGLIARNYLRLNDTEGAIEIYQKQIKNAPYNYNGYLGIASIMKKEKRYTESLEYYTKTLTALNRDIGYFQPSFAHIFQSKAEVCYALKKYDEAIDAINKVILLGNYKAYDFRARCHLEAGEIDAALYDLKQLKKYVPDYTTKTSIKDTKNIRNYTPDEEWLKQVEAYKLFLQIENIPNNSEEITKAIGILDKALKITPKNPYFIGLRGFLLTESDEEKAMLDFNTLVNILPDCSEAYLFRSGLHNTDLKAAVEDMDKAILLNQHDSFYYMTRASL